MKPINFKNPIEYAFKQQEAALKCDLYMTKCEMVIVYNGLYKSRQLFVLRTNIEGPIHRGIYKNLGPLPP